MMRLSFWKARSRIMYKMKVEELENWARAWSTNKTGNEACLAHILYTLRVSLIG